MSYKFPSKEKAFASPFYRAISQFPGDLIIERWKESRAIALEDIQKKLADTEPERAKKLTDEVNQKLLPEHYVVYVLRKYMEDYTK